MAPPSGPPRRLTAARTHPTPARQGIEAAHPGRPGGPAAAPPGTPGKAPATPRFSLRRSARATLVVIGLVTAGTVGLAGPAAAHHALTGSDPADGATVDDPPTSISLTFDQPVQGSDVVQTLVVVTGPDDQQYQDGPPTTAGDVITTAVAPLTAAGQYAVAYRVISDQGAVGGLIHFTLLHPATTTGPATPGRG